MAKVDKIQIRFNGEYKQFDICFTKNDLFYIKDCPQEILDYGEFNNRAGKLDEVRTRFTTAVIKAEETLMRSRKVILVLFSISSDLISEPIPTGGSIVLCSHPLYKFCASFGSRFEGYGFSIDYRLAIEVSRGTEKLYYSPCAGNLKYRRGALHVKDGEIVIPYSDKAIETLESIKSSMKDMIFRIAGFFSNADNLQTALETGNLKMLN